MKTLVVRPAARVDHFLDIRVVCLGREFGAGAQEDRIHAVDPGRLSIGFFPVRCCPGEPYTIAVLQGERKDGRLQQMYRPIHETLRQGFAARAHECGYEVKIATSGAATRGRPSSPSACRKS